MMTSRISNCELLMEILKENPIKPIVLDFSYLKTYKKVNSLKRKNSPLFKGNLLFGIIFIMSLVNLDSFRNS